MDDDQKTIWAALNEIYAGFLAGDPENGRVIHPGDANAQTRHALGLALAASAELGAI